MNTTVPTQLHKNQLPLCTPGLDWFADYTNEWLIGDHYGEVTSFMANFINGNFNLFLVNDVKVHLKSGVKTRGIFLGDVRPLEMYLSTANITKELLLEYLCHEYCHYIQHVKNVNLLRVGDDDIYDNYLFGKLKRTEEIENVFMRILSQEIDCNKKALKLIKEAKLPISTKDFIKRANAYHFYHFAALEKAQDYITDPSEIVSLVEKMPTEIIEAEDIHKYFVLSDFEECFT